jgi:hypothetical protein
MGEKLETFIKGLSDHEFAVFLMYQSEGLLPYAQQIIKNEIANRQLTKNQIETQGNMRLSYNEEGDFCARCGSNKIFKETDIEYKNSNHFTREIEVMTHRCRLCNYNSSKEEKNLIEKIKLFFVGDPNKSTRTLKSYDWFGD